MCSIQLEMTIQTRSGDLLWLKDSIKESSNDIINRMNTTDRKRDEADRVRDQTLKSMQDNMIALNVQQTELMECVIKERGDANVRGDNRGNNGRMGVPKAVHDHIPRAPYFAIRQSKVGFPTFNGDDLNGWIFVACIF